MQLPSEFSTFIGVTAPCTLSGPTTKKKHFFYVCLPLVFFNFLVPRSIKMRLYCIAPYLATFASQFISQILYDFNPASTPHNSQAQLH